MKAKEMSRFDRFGQRGEDAQNLVSHRGGEGHDAGGQGLERVHERAVGGFAGGSARGDEISDDGHQFRVYLHIHHI